MKKLGLLAGVSLVSLTVLAAAQAPVPAAMPWMNATLSPDKRADLVLAVMTQDEKLQLVHGYGSAVEGSTGGAGYVKGIPHLGLPDLNMADSSVGLTRNGIHARYSTLMPATIGEAASWDPQIAYGYGALIGRELLAQGYNVSLGGGMNIMREPRNGRSFEYLAEDPVLTGEIYTQWVHGLQDQKVIGDIKHFAFNDQETGRTIGNVVLPDERSMRESDLLSFEIGVKKGKPGMVMCSYNKVNGDWSCENDYLLNQVLKKDWGFQGFVLSDWGGTHSAAKAALAGLDQEQPGSVYFGDALKQAIQAGTVPQSRLDDMVHRILRTEFSAGIVDSAPTPHVVDVFAGLEVAQTTAEAGSVLLKNNGVLPLDAAKTKSIVIIGSHADVGVLTGGGSGQVDPPGGNAVVGEVAPQAPNGSPARATVWWPSSPLKAITARARGVKVSYDAGRDPAAAAAAARGADVAIVFVNQPAREGADHPDLSLPDNQDAVVAAVTAANPHTIVVLETGGPVTMPWISSAAAVMEIWYPGSRGAEATTNLLFGDVNFTAKLPVTFPAREADLPVTVIAGTNLTPIPAPPVTTTNASAVVASAVGSVASANRVRMTLPPFNIDYPQKANVGYKWFDAQNTAPLFPFGFGLSYTSYAYSGLTATANQAVFTVKNTGTKDGAEIAEVYARRPGDAPTFKRLVGWSKVPLKAGETKTVTVVLDPMYLSIFDTAKHRWVEQAGSYTLLAGASSRDTPLTARFVLSKAQ